MNILSFTGVSKTLNSVPLFEDVTLGIDDGEKVGFVGRNGAGKSTLLAIVHGEIEPDSGTVSRNNLLRIARVGQRPDFHPEMSLEDFFHAEKPTDGTDAGALSDVGARSDVGASFAGVEAFRSYCRELGLADFSAKLGTFSGGMIRKASIARCLAAGANFLTLDEPTNHLDIETVEWLETLLQSTKDGFILVTHDRYFLDSVCTSIMEIENGRIYKYPGSYEEYLERKAGRAADEQRAEQRRVTILRREMEWLKRGPRARTGKDKKRKARVEDLTDSLIQQELSIREFTSSHRRLGKKILELHGVAKSYDGALIVSPFTYNLRRGERIGIIGPNGSGKSTFLKLACGLVEPDDGEVVKGENTVFGYFDQTGAFIDGRMTVLEYIRAQAERIRMADESWLSAEQFLERFLFARSTFSMPLELLSGGEFRRLYLIRLLASAPNFLLLDEPTNDLDIETIRLLEDYLSDFAGCILVVSHDRALLDRLTDQLFIFDGAGGIRGFVGSYAEYRQAAQEERAQRAREFRAESKSRTRVGEAGRPVQRAQKRELSFRERREYETLLAEIAELELAQRKLEDFFQAPALDPGELERNTRRYAELRSSIAEKTNRWEELAERGET
ncbi:MAG TPA: ABC-F family ATP-binding cassette domain-containing protein [Spirochaetia bacterium]|nr:ABC-F family ATP-binding cassette domain-containing protein [Spirochaetia bacterium]